MRSQKKELEEKLRLSIKDSDLTNVIRAIDNEIERAQIELAKLSCKAPREKANDSSRDLPDSLTQEQETEGFSMPAERKTNLEYALKNGFQIVRRI